jgi:putative hydrolase of the HAD superfamily
MAAAVLADPCGVTGVTTVGFRGVLFDSGDTLIRPVGGRWNPRFDFEEIVLRHLPELAMDSLPQAFAAGQRVLDAGPTTPTLAEYHRVILGALGVRRPPPKLLEELQQPSIRPPVEPFPEVPVVLERLRAGGVRMAIVSDSWPGLEQLYRRLGLDIYFQAFVISAVLGCNKPDPRMYRAGSEALGLPPHECVFVDDAPELVTAAIELGYGGTAIVRTSDPPATVPWISTLEDLIPMTGR